MSTIQVMRHVFTRKAPNVAKYGHPAPREGYINTFMEEVPEPASREEWNELDAWLDAEYQAAKAEQDAWLGGTP